MYAFVDESHRSRPDGTGSYFFGVILVHPGRASDARTTLIKSLPKHLNRFHFSTAWHRAGAMGHDLHPGTSPQYPHVPEDLRGVVQP